MLPKIEISYAHKTAILFGATGLVGSYCLRRLVSQENYDKVIVFTRKEISFSHKKIIHHQTGNLPIYEFEDKIVGDDIFICLGTTMAKAKSKEAFEKFDFNYIFEIAKAAKLNGVKQISLISSVGSAESSYFHYGRVKGRLESAVKKLGFWSTHILQPSFLIGYREESRLKEDILSAFIGGFRFLIKGRMGKYEPIEADKVAKVMIDVAQGVESGVHIYPSDQIISLYTEQSLISK